jgi:hypothetical protein
MDDNDTSIVGQSTWYPDYDGDDYGDSTLPLLACNQPTDYVDN